MLALFIRGEDHYRRISEQSNATVTNYFTIFLQNVDMTNLVLVFI